MFALLKSCRKVNMYSAMGFLLKALLFMCLYSQLDADFAYTHGNQDLKTMSGITAKDGADVGLALAVERRLRKLAKGDINDLNTQVDQSIDLLKNSHQCGLFSPLIYNTLVSVKGANGDVKAINNIIDQARKTGVELDGKNSAYNKVYKTIKTMADSPSITDYQAYAFFDAVYQVTRKGSLNGPVLNQLFLCAIQQLSGKTGPAADIVNKQLKTFASQGSNMDAIQKGASDARDSVDTGSQGGDPNKALAAAIKDAQTKGSVSAVNAAAIVKALLGIANTDPTKLKNALMDTQDKLKTYTGPDAATVLAAIADALKGTDPASMKTPLTAAKTKLQLQAAAENAVTDLATLGDKIKAANIIYYIDAAALFSDLSDIAAAGNSPKFTMDLNDLSNKLAGITGPAAKDVQGYLDKLKGFGSDISAIQAGVKDNLKTLQDEEEALRMAILNFYIDLSEATTQKFAYPIADKLNTENGKPADIPAPSKSK